MRGSNWIKKVRLNITAFFKKEDGATAIEFALVSVVFLAFVFGIMETGRIMWTYNGVEYAIENAARFALVNSDAATDDIIAVATESLDDMHLSQDPFSAEVSFTQDADGANYIEITGSYQYTALITAFLPPSLSSFTLSAEVQRPIDWVTE